MTTYDPPVPQSPSQQPPLQQPPYYPAPQRSRPLGVTILAILEILSGLVSLLAAIGMFALGALTSSQDIINQLGQEVPQWMIDNGPLLFTGIGVVFLIMALVAFLLAWGFLKGKKWAWILGIIFAVLSIVSSIGQALLTGDLSAIATVGFSILIPVIILVYLLLPKTKAWFGV